MHPYRNNVQLERGLTVLKINKPIDSIREVLLREFNAYEINQIKTRYKGERSASKAPTFRPDL